jgi:hypothetical protein
LKPYIYTSYSKDKPMQKKNILVIFTLLAAVACLPAQITITNASFPVAGDSLKIANDLNPANIVLNPPGGPYNWDYSALNPTTRSVETVQPAANGAHFATFPNAELVSINNLGAETYFDVTSTTFSVLGVSGGNLGGGGLPFATDLIFTPPMVQLHAPLSFPGVFTGTSSFNIAIAVSDLPGGILDSLGVPTGLFDSIRIKLSIERNDFVDAYGTMTIPGGTYNVLRVKRTDNSNTRLEIHIPFLGWQDVTDLLGAGGFGTDTTLTYNFLTNTAKEPIAVLTMDSTGTVVQQVDYKDNGIQSAIEPVISDRVGVVASPNPASNETTFTFKNIKSGHYTIRLLDMNGNSVWSKELTSASELVPLQSLSGGMYLYQLIDANNRVIATGKLVKGD